MPLREFSSGKRDEVADGVSEGGGGGAVEIQIGDAGIVILLFLNIFK